VTAPPFDVLDVTSWEVAEEEASGEDEKVWLLDPRPSAFPQRWLYKPITQHPDRAQGEDWAEKLVSEIGSLLTVPCAEVELASRGGQRGLLSLNLRPDGWELQPGAVVLSAVDPKYRPGRLDPKGRPGHSLTNIAAVLADCDPPLGTSVPAEMSAFDVFAGYLLLDAWVANRDRHDENWAVMRAQVGGGRLALAGSYDHAGSLGFNLTDRARTRLVQADDVRRWASRGTAWRFEHDPSAAPSQCPTLVRLASDALNQGSPLAHAFWLDRLENVTLDTLEQLVARVPEMSDPARTFALRLLDINRRRLLDECIRSA
jgi:hypothetical protein